MRRYEWLLPIHNFSIPALSPSTTQIVHNDSHLLILANIANTTNTLWWSWCQRIHTIIRTTQTSMRTCEKKIGCNSISHKQKQPYGQLRSVSRLIVTDTAAFVCLFPIESNIYFAFSYQLKFVSLIIWFSAFRVIRCFVFHIINWLQCRAPAQYICFCLLRLFQSQIGFRLVCARMLTQRDIWIFDICLAFDWLNWLSLPTDVLNSICHTMSSLGTALRLPIRRSTVCLSFIANFIFPPNVKKK